MFSQLMRTRRFAPLFWCQFFSAFNDNFVRQLLAMLILFRFGAEDAGVKVTLAVAVFILPSIPLSPIGGEFADAHDKAAVAQRLKLAEIFVQLDRRGRLLVLVARAALSRAVRPRLHFGAVRSDQVRHPARPPEVRGADPRQRAGRSGDLRRHPLRAGDRRLGGGRGALGLERRRPARRRRRRLLRVLAVHSRHRGRRARPGRRLQPVDGDRRRSARSSGPTIANGSARPR